MSDATSNLSRFDQDLNSVYNSVVSGDFNLAVVATKMLNRLGVGILITDLVKRLVDADVSNTMIYAYKLWNSSQRSVVTSYFPPAFKLILNGDVVSVVNQKYGLPLKLQVNVDDQGDRQAWGEADKSHHERTKWKFVSIWENNQLFFKIINVEYNQYLKLVQKTDGDGEHNAFASNEKDTLRHQWYLRPAMDGSTLIFYILNRQYDQGLKLGVWQDDRKDRMVWSHNGNITGKPNDFGWKIEQF